MRILLILLLISVSYRGAVANNNLFLPGDAYFPMQLTADDCRQLQEGNAGDKVFYYASMGGYEGAFCGYAGFHEAKLTSVDRKFINNLVTAYGVTRENEHKELREVIENGKPRLIETNGMRVLFYPQEFDFQKNKLGLRYNENWATVAEKFGHERRHLRLCELIDSSEAVGVSWRDAPHVGTFRAVWPKPLKLNGKGDEAPITFEGPVKAIVLSQNTLKEYFENKRITMIHVVDSTGIQRWYGESGEWQLQNEK
jgi:hypothetical protein